MKGAGERSSQAQKAVSGGRAFRDARRCGRSPDPAARLGEAGAFEAPARQRGDAAGILEDAGHEAVAGPGRSMVVYMPSLLRPGLVPPKPAAGEPPSCRTLAAPRCIACRCATRAIPAAIEALFDAGTLDPGAVVAILGKTEGNGCVNDFTRAYAVQALSQMLARRLGSSAEAVQAADRPGHVGRDGGRAVAAFPGAGGRGGRGTGAARLCWRIGTAFTGDFAPDEDRPDGPCGRPAAVAVRAAMAEAGIIEPADVDDVAGRVAAAHQRAQAEARARGAVGWRWRRPTASTGLFRGASALGVGAGAGEGEVRLMLQENTDTARDGRYAPGRASASAGARADAERDQDRTGSSTAGAGDLGNRARGDGSGRDRPAGAASGARAGRVADLEVGQARAGRRRSAHRRRWPRRGRHPAGRPAGACTPRWDDSDINATRHARALVGGDGSPGRLAVWILLSAAVLVHQGPDGGGPVAVILRPARRG